MDKVFASVLAAVLVCVIGILFLPLVWWWKPILIVALYLFIVFVLSRLFVPHLGFVKSRLPSSVDSIIQKEIDSLKGSQEDVLRQAYAVVTKKLHGASGKTFEHMSRLFRKDDSKIWREGGYCNCHTMNYFLRLFLVKSGKFQDDDIKLHHVMYRYNIHQNMWVKLNGRWVALDPGMDYAGIIPFARKNDNWWNKGVKEHKYDGIYLK